MTEDLGTPTRPHALTGEQWRLEVRTDDPPSPSADERWIRSDLDGGDRVATLKCGDGTEIPLFPTGTAEETVREARRYRVGGQTVYAPLAPVDEAAFPARRVQHGGQTHAFHDSVGPGSAIPDSGVSRWTFDNTDTESGTALDAWSNNDGTINGATTGVSGANQTYTTNEAYSFDGSDDYVGVSTAVVTSFPFSFATWVNTSNSVDNLHSLTIADVETGGRLFGIGVRSGDASVFALNSGNFVSAGNVSVADGSWSLVTGVLESDQITVYVDDGSGVSTSHSNPIVTVNTTDIGRSGDGTPGDYFEGDIDDVRVYDKALTSTEVSNLYNTGSING